LSKKVQKSTEVMYCSVSTRVKDFLMNFFPRGVRKDVINRALYFYFLKGYYKELSPFFEEEDFFKIEQQVKEIFKKKYSQGRKKRENVSNNSISDSDLLSNKFENSEQNEKISVKEKIQDNIVNVNDIDFDINDEEYINEFDY